jgi:hypothetical protein
MEWLSENWLWVLAGLVLLYVVYRWGRSRSARSSSKNYISRPAPTRSAANTTSSRLTREQEMAAAGFLLSRLTEAMETVVDETVGRHYDKHDRHKIAMGMVAVMAAEEVSLERMTSEPALFAAVMIQSIATLTSVGEISAH